MGTCKIIALANQKGGVGKTTSTYNLAAAKATQGERVLMIDLDPQASLTISCGIILGDPYYDHNVCDLFNSKADPVDCCYSVDASKLENLYIVPSDLDLALVERNLVTSRNSDVQLRKATQKLRAYFDYILIDCPPQLGTLLTNALTAADAVIVPVKTDYLSYRGLNTLKDTIEGVKSGDGDRSLNPALDFIGVIATMYQVSSNDHREILESLKQWYKVLGVIRNTVDVNRKITEGLPVVLANPKSEVAGSYKAVSNYI